mmetsp:Transcript_5466/g.9251  ORF Transcript_5466/g.9251 Transcript_5466/m.9251 type:complete len:307 (-) Transcript_5466:25-945(-)
MQPPRQGIPPGVHRGRNQKDLRSPRHHRERQDDLHPPEPRGLPLRLRLLPAAQRGLRGHSQPQRQVLRRKDPRGQALRDQGAQAEPDPAGQGQKQLRGLLQQQEGWRHRLPGRVRHHEHPRNGADSAASAPGRPPPDDPEPAPQPDGPQKQLQQQLSPRPPRAERRRPAASGPAHPAPGSPEHARPRIDDDARGPPAPHAHDAHARPADDSRPGVPRQGHADPPLHPAQQQGLQETSRRTDLPLPLEDGARRERAQTHGNADRAAHRAGARVPLQLPSADRDGAGGQPDRGAAEVAAAAGLSVTFN